jgi:hypothetical protein
MNRIKSFREHSQEIVESQIRARIIQILHEGVRMVHTSSPLNESKYPELQRMLDKAEREGKQLIIAEFVPEIEALVDKFGESGQSGGSAPFTAAAIVDTIKKMLAHEPLGDGIECTDEEWNDVSGPSDLKPTSFYQNNRLSSVFKEGKEGKPYYLDAIVFKPVGKDYTFTGSVSMTEGVEERIGSSQYIKSLPFTPKTFIIDVEEKEYRKNEDGTLVEEQGGGWWESWLADSSQLEEVFEYYDRKECHKG